MPKAHLLKLAMTALLCTGCVGQDDASPVGDNQGVSTDSAGNPKPENFEVSDNKNLDPSLCACVLQAELDQVQKLIERKKSSTSFLGGGSLPRDTPDRIFFALADSNRSWVAPPDSLIEEIGSESVRSAKEVKGNNPVYFLSNIHWVDSHTVVLDKENIQGDAHSAMRKMKLSKTDGTWKVLDEGEFWGRNSADDNPFKSHSNSGLPIQ